MRADRWGKKQSHPHKEQRNPIARLGSCERTRFVLSSPARGGTLPRKTPTQHTHTVSPERRTYEIGACQGDKPKHFTNYMLRLGVAQSTHSTSHPGALVFCRRFSGHFRWAKSGSCAPIGPTSNFLRDLNRLVELDAQVGDGIQRKNRVSALSLRDLRKQPPPAVQPFLSGVSSALHPRLQRPIGELRGTSLCRSC